MKGQLLKRSIVDICVCDSATDQILLTTTSNCFNFQQGLGYGGWMMIISFLIIYDSPSRLYVAEKWSVSSKSLVAKYNKPVHSVFEDCCTRQLILLGPIACSRIMDTATYPS